MGPVETCKKMKSSRGGDIEYMHVGVGWEQRLGAARARGWRRTAGDARKRDPVDHPKAEYHCSWLDQVLIGMGDCHQGLQEFWGGRPEQAHHGRGQH